MIVHTAGITVVAAHADIALAAALRKGLIHRTMKPPGRRTMNSLFFGIFTLPHAYQNHGIH